MLRQKIRSLDLSYPPGSSTNNREVLELLKVIDGVTWGHVSADQGKRSAARSIEYSPGRKGPGDDFVWYDQGTKSPLGDESAHALRSNQREMLEHQPIRYIFEPHSVLDEFWTGDEDFEEPQSPQWEQGSADGITLGSPNNGDQGMLVQDEEVATVLQFLHETGCTLAETEDGYLDLVELFQTRFVSAYQVEGPRRSRRRRGA